MKKISKRFLIISGILVLMIVIFGAIMIAPFLSMKPTPTGKIDHTEIFAVKNKLNSLYFIESDDGDILVDAGSDITAIRKTLQDFNIDPLNVKYVLLTHSDGDHVASLGLFPNATIYMSQKELQMINGTTKRSGNHYNTLPEEIERENFVLLTDEQELIIGQHKIICLDATGHTPGSMAFLFDGSYLFTGDAFKVNKNSLDVHPFSMDSDASKKSIQQLNDIIKDIKLVLTAHYGWQKSEDLILTNEQPL